MISISIREDIPLFPPIGSVVPMGSSTPSRLVSCKRGSWFCNEKPMIMGGRGPGMATRERKVNKKHRKEGDYILWYIMFIIPIGFVYGIFICRNDCFHVGKYTSPMIMNPLRDVFFYSLMDWVSYPSIPPSRWMILRSLFSSVFYTKGVCRGPWLSGTNNLTK